MKISSASKKVLASALSAAMVVAFAPTAAFGLTTSTGKVTVEFSAGEGTGSLDAYTYTADGDQKITLNASGADIAHAFTNGAGYEFAGFYWDKNENGAKDAGEATIASTDLGTATDAFKDVADGSTVKLVAYYNAPVASLTAAVAQSKPSNGTAFTVGSLGNLQATHTYNYTISKNGAVIYTSNDFTGSASTSDDAIEWTNSASAAIQGSKKVLNSAWGAGSFTLTVTDKTAGKSWTDTKDILTATFDTTSAGYFDQNTDTGAYITTKTQLFAKGTKASEVAALVNGSDVHKAGTADFDKWTLNGEAVTDAAVNADATFTAVYKVPQIASTAFDADAKKIAFKAGYLGTTGTGDTDIQKYTVAIAGPDGLSVSYETAVANSDQAFCLSLGQTMTGYAGANYSTTAAVASGEYTITLTPVYKDTYTGTKAGAVSGKISIVALTLDANGGKIGNDATKTSFAKAGASDYETLINSATAALDGQVFKGWSTDGTVANIVKNTDKVSADTTLKAAWATEAYTKPAYTVDAAANNAFTIKATAEDGAIVKYSTDNKTWYTLQSSGFTTTAANVYLKAVKSGSTGLTDSDLVSLSASASSVSSYGSAFSAIVGTGVEDPTAPLLQNTTPAKHQTYAYVYGDTKKAGEAAIKAIGYATAADWNKAVNAQVVSDLKTIVSNAEGYLDSLGEGIAQTDGSLVKGSAADIAAAKTALAAVVTKAEAAQAAADKACNVLTVANDFKAEKVAAAVNTVKTTKIDAADVKAAAAVDAQIAKLATDYAEVTKDNYEAAATAAADVQTAYAALSETQKALVKEDTQVISKVLLDAASVAAQVKDEEAKKAAEEAAAKLADAQDQAAANLLYSKTVTAKAKVGKKAQGKSFTYKLAASESGATATYAKASGSKYIKVSASGKVTFSKVKVAKKAKTYKAKVTVTYGTKTCTKTVTYKVVKK